MTKIVEFRKTTKTFILWHFQKKKLLSILQRIHSHITFSRNSYQVVVNFNDCFPFFSIMSERWFIFLLQGNVNEKIGPKKMNTVEKKISIFFFFKFGKIWQEFLRQKGKVQKFVWEGKKCWYWMYFVHKADVNSKFWYFRQFRPLLSPLWIPPAWQPFRHWRERVQDRRWSPQLCA